MSPLSRSTWLKSSDTGHGKSRRGRRIAAALAVLALAAGMSATAAPVSASDYYYWQEEYDLLVARGNAAIEWTNLVPVGANLGMAGFSNPRFNMDPKARYVFNTEMTMGPPRVGGVRGMGDYHAEFGQDMTNFLIEESGVATIRPLFAPTASVKTYKIQMWDSIESSQFSQVLINQTCLASNGSRVFQRNSWDPGCSAARDEYAGEAVDDMTDWILNEISPGVVEIINVGDLKRANNFVFAAKVLTATPDGYVRPQPRGTTGWSTWQLKTGAYGLWMFAPGS